jgi:hypothetical protein
MLHETVTHSVAVALSLQVLLATASAATSCCSCCCCWSLVCAACSQVAATMPLRAAFSACSCSIRCSCWCICVCSSATAAATSRCLRSSLAALHVNNHLHAESTVSKCYRCDSHYVMRYGISSEDSILYMTRRLCILAQAQACGDALLIAISCSHGYTATLSVHVE